MWSFQSERKKRSQQFSATKLEMGLGRLDLEKHKERYGSNMNLTVTLAGVTLQVQTFLKKFKKKNCHIFFKKNASLRSHWLLKVKQAHITSLGRETLKAF